MVLTSTIFPADEVGPAGTAGGEGLAFEGADGDGLAPFDRAVGLELGAGLADVEAADGMGRAELADGAAGAEVAAGPTAAVEPPGPPNGPAGIGAGAEDATGADADGAAALFEAVHPAVTKTGTSTSAAAIRRIPPSWPTLGQYLANGARFDPSARWSVLLEVGALQCAYRCASVVGVACPR